MKLGGELKHVKGSGSFGSICHSQISCFNVSFPGAVRFKKIKATDLNCKLTVLGNVRRKSL